MNLENVAPKIEYIKSSLSINTSIGCYLGCEYCVVGEILTKKVPKRVSTPRETVDSLLKNNLFVPDETLLAINNKTDPFLGYVKEDTFEIMELLKERGLKNPLMIISRLPLTKRDLSYLEEFEAPTFFVTSYSHLSYPVEKSNSENQLTSLRSLRDRKNVKSIHYWRPLIKGLNDSDSSISRVLENVVDSCDASVLSGLRLNHPIAEKMRSFGADLSAWDGDMSHKYLPEGIQDRIIDFRNRYHQGYRLFRHTSCAVSTLLGKDDYGLNFLKGSTHCMDDCDRKCHLSSVSDTWVKTLLDHLGIDFPFNIESDSVCIDGEISQEQKSFLSHQLHFPISPKKLKIGSSNKSFEKGSGDDS